MSETAYPDMITGLPRADIPIDGVRGWIAQAANRQIVFFDIDPIGEIPPHSHGEQWGVVVEGRMELSGGDSSECPLPYRFPPVEPLSCSM